MHPIILPFPFIPSRQRRGIFTFYEFINKGYSNIFQARFQFNFWALIRLCSIFFAITLVQNRFFTTESQRAQRNIFLLVPVQPEQIKSLLSLQNRDPILCQGPVRRLQFYPRREGIYDPIAASRLDHNKSSSASVYSVAPWWTWFQKGRMSFQKPNEINVTPLAFELIGQQCFHILLSFLCSTHPEASSLSPVSLSLSAIIC